MATSELVKRRAGNVSAVISYEAILHDRCLKSIQISVQMNYSRIFQDGSLLSPPIHTYEKMNPNVLQQESATVN
jgi:hypothetical protein